MRIQLFGSPAIVVDGQRIEHPARKVMALLTYLAMRADEHLSRGHLSALLWSDSGEEQARANLRQTLSQLRKLFQATGRDPLLVPFDNVLLPSQGIEIDVNRILSDLGNRDLSELAGLPPFAEGLSVQAPEFESWAAAQRRMIQARIIAHLRDRAATARAERRTAEEVESLSLALSMDSLQEDLHRDLIQALVAMGRSDEALKQYELCRTILRRDLQVEPESATRALAAAIRGQRQFRSGAQPNAQAFNRFPAPAPAAVFASGPTFDKKPQAFGTATDALAHALALMRAAPEPSATTVAVGDLADGPYLLAQTEPGAIAVAASVVREFEQWSPFSFGLSETLPDGRIAYRLLSEMPRHRLALQPTVTEPEHASVPEFSVAVLPFQDFSRTAADFSVGDFLAEEIIHRLSRHRGLTVAAPSAGQAFRKLGHAAGRARRMLGVNYLVDGRIQREGGLLAVHLTVTDLRRDHLVFSHRFDGLFPGPLLDQNDLSDQIASALFHRTQGAEILRAERAPTADHGAFEWYLLGLSDHRRSGISPKYARSAFSKFSKAIEIDPRFARAIAWRLCAASWYDPEFLEEPGYQQIQEALGNAEDDAEVHRVAGALCMQRGDHDRGIFHLERAIALNPSDAYLLATAAIYWAYGGEPERGLPHIERAMRLDPFLPAWCIEDHGILLYALNEFDGAIASLRKLTSTSARSMAYLAASFIASGRLPEAQAAVGAIRRVAPDYSVNELLKTAYFRRPEDRDQIRSLLLRAGLDS